MCSAQSQQLNHVMAGSLLPALRPLGFAGQMLMLPESCASDLHPPLTLLFPPASWRKEKRVLYSNLTPFKIIHSSKVLATH